MKDNIPFRVSPMLARLVAKPFDKPGWVYEEKYDGYRVLAYKEGDRVSLLSRNGINRADSFPGIAQAIGKLESRTLLLDGEVVAFGRDNISRFQLLQEHKSEPKYAVFDCLYRDGRDLSDNKLSDRRLELEAAVGKAELIFVSRRLAANGLTAYRVAKRKGYEGLVAKDSASHYVEGRSSLWLKVKVHQEDEFVIAGFTPPGGSRKYFGALLLGAYDDAKLRYVGKVGTGFDSETLRSLYQKFKPLIRKSPALVDPPREKSATYLTPKLVAQISYQELTADRKLRQPVFLGLRDDKQAQDVILPKAT